ncbi:MAG: hypothetical protein AAB473_05460 [Patescibacteria group bacterium]
MPKPIERTPQERSQIIISAVLECLNAFPDFHEEYSAISPSEIVAIQKSLEHIVTTVLADDMIDDKPQPMAKRLLSDLSHRGGIRQGFFDPMESEDRGNLVRDVAFVIYRNLRV